MLTILILPKIDKNAEHPSHQKNAIKYFDRPCNNKHNNLSIFESNENEATILLR